MSSTIARARRDDAFACAALRLQLDLEAGQPHRAGFIPEYADHWLAHFDDLPTWLATAPDGTAVGMIQTGLLHRPPTLSRPARPWLSVDAVFVTPAARGQRMGARMFRTLEAWAGAHGVERMVLSTSSQPRTLCDRAGFGAPEGLMYRDGPFETEENAR